MPYAVKVAEAGKEIEANDRKWPNSEIRRGLLSSLDPSPDQRELVTEPTQTPAYAGVAWR